MFAQSLRLALRPALRPAPALAVLALAAGLGTAGAGEYGHARPYGRVHAPGYVYGGPYGYAGSYGGYGFADEAVRGAYIGAPLTRFPRPSEIVPPAWSYGTYGIPTVSGITRAPVGEPTLTVINAEAPVPRRAGGARILSRSETGRWARIDAPLDASAGTGARVITVQVPRR